jgi:hypothetical protein
LHAIAAIPCFAVVFACMDNNAGVNVALAAGGKHKFPGGVAV